MSDKEWHGLMEFLATPYDPDKNTPESMPWAYLMRTSRRR